MLYLLLRPTSILKYNLSHCHQARRDNRWRVHLGLSRSQAKRAHLLLPVQVSRSYALSSIVYVSTLMTLTAKAIAWTTRFTISSAEGKTEEAPERTQPDGKAIPWGKGELVGKSKDAAKPEPKFAEERAWFCSLPCFH